VEENGENDDGSRAVDSRKRRRKIVRRQHEDAIVIVWPSNVVVNLARLKAEEIAATRQINESKFIKRIK